jgi:hypothetical protein
MLLQIILNKVIDLRNPHTASNFRKNIIIKRNGHPAPSRVAALGSRAQGRAHPCPGEDLGVEVAGLPLVPRSQARVLGRGAAEALAWEAQSHPLLKCLVNRNRALPNFRKFVPPRPGEDEILYIQLMHLPASLRLRL